ncbi:MAG: class I SAM-dependent methyltransferase [Bacteroidales bacterium]|nr:class I SAM-dependent methyltransferase [Bacteroidales bacterium]
MNTFLIKKTIGYLLTAGHKYGHRIHSPFVYDLIQSVFRAKPSKSVFKKIEKRRKCLLNDSTEIKIQDFGAGSKQNASNCRKINYIASTSLSDGKYAKLLYNLVHRYQPQTVLELGTSLGISTAYLACGAPDAKIISLEGAESIAEYAKETMKQCEVDNVKIIVGNFNDTLSSALEELGSVDCAFIDGNHTKEATLRYFEQIFPYCNSNTVLIFDDISWSEGMNEAWKTIIADERVTVSVDLCQKGLVFFREGIIKQDFVIRY